MKYLRIFSIISLLLLSMSVIANLQSKFFWQCNNKQICNLYAKTSEGNKLIFSHWDKADIGNVAFRPYGNHLGKFSYSCGSPCDYATFVDFNSGKVSTPFFLVFAVDSKNLLVAIPDPRDEKDSTLEVSPIFDNEEPIKKIEKDFSHGVSISLDKAEFFKDKLYIEYQFGKNFRDTHEIIAINYKKQNESTYDESH